MVHLQRFLDGRRTLPWARRPDVHKKTATENHQQLAAKNKATELASIACHHGKAVVPATAKKLANGADRLEGPGPIQQISVK